MIPSQSQAFPATTTGIILIQGRGVLTGWAVKETTGAAPAVLNVWDGTDNRGLLLAPVNLASNESNREWFSDWGVAFSRGLFVEVTSGSVSGALWIIPQELVPMGGEFLAYATGPGTDGYPTLGADGT